MELSTGPQGGSEKVSSIQIDANTPSELQGDCEKAAGRDIGVLNANVVDWNNAEDIENPQNFKSREKWTIIVLVSAITFNQAMSSTIFAPGAAQAMHDLGAQSSIYTSLSVSIFVVGLAIGPLISAPLSELYGRTPLMHTSNVTFLVAAIICAVSNSVPLFLTFRLLMGANTISLGSGYVADMMGPEERGRALNVWTIGPVLAPVLGPILGGYISIKASWRWTFGLVGILGFFSIVASVLLLRETYPPRLLELKTRRLQKETGNDQLRSRYHKDATPAQLLRLSIMRPLVMLVRCPIVGIISLFLAIAYSYMYLLFTTFTGVFESTYGFSAGEAGLSYLGLGVGFLFGQYTFDILVQWRSRQVSATGQEMVPEDQLPPLVLGSLLIAAGLIWYGWSAEYKVHCIVPVIGTSLCGIGITYFFLVVQAYLVEAYTLHAASALAANVLIRSIFGVTIPLAGPPLYSNLGLGWGNSLLGSLALVVALASMMMMKYGKMIRINPRFVPEL